MTRLLVLLACLFALAGAGAAGAAPHTNLNEAGDVEVTDQLTSISGFVTLAAASAEQTGCNSSLLSRNFSSRNGVRPTMIVLHYTVSRNISGWSDVIAIRDFFNQDRTDASSHYLIDFEGNCLQIVREGDKAWTQGNANPFSLSIEFIALGSERVWPTAGLAKGARVVAGMAKRWDIPVRLIDPIGCNFGTRGLTDHNRLECGNSHTDVSPFFPMTKFVGMVKTLLEPPPRFKVTVNPLGDAKPVVVWKGRNAPNKVAVSKGTSTTQPWRVSVGAKVVWRGKFYPTSATAGRL